MKITSGLTPASRTFGNAMVRHGAVAALLMGIASPAAAHIDLASHETRPRGDQKSSPCEGVARGGNVYTYQPGETITITVDESIGHPGYFRIAFDADGEDDFVIPSGTEGTDGNCSGDSACGPGKADYCNSPAVMWDHLDQHNAGLLSGGSHTFTVTLPDIECENCTIQVIQMMNDLNNHPTPYPADDIYYRCIDLVLSKDAPAVDDAPGTNNGMQCDSFDALATGGTAVDPGGMTTDAGVPADGGMVADGGMPDPTTGGAATTGGSPATTTGAAPSTTGAAPTTTGAAPTTTGAVSTGGATTTGGSPVVDTTGGAGATTGEVATGTTTGTPAATTTGPATPAASSEGGGCSASRSPGQLAGAWLSLFVVGSVVAIRRRGRFASSAR